MSPVPTRVVEFLVNPMTEFLMWTALVLSVLLAAGWFLSYTAVRLDRLHHKMHATAAALDAQLVRRAEATLEYALSGLLDPATSTLLASAATQALRSPGSWNAERAEAESELTEVLRAAEETLTAVQPLDSEHNSDEPFALVRAAGLRVRLARRFHNEAVGDVIRLRERPQTRWFRLAGHAPMPTLVTFDDSWPVD